MKIYVLGGTFDPPHLGHLKIVEKLNSECDLFMIIPTNVSPHKTMKNQTSSHHRLKMCLIQFLDKFENVEILDYEINKHDISFTIDTVEWLKNKFKDASITLIIGEDQGENLNAWKNIDKLKEMVKFTCISRRGYQIESQEYISYRDDIDMKISSTKIRENWWKKNDLYKRMVLPEIESYINQNKLYN